jgi:hypothetical protein
MILEKDVCIISEEDALQIIAEEAERFFAEASVFVQFAAYLLFTVPTQFLAVKKLYEVVREGDYDAAIAFWEKLAVEYQFGTMSPAQEQGFEEAILRDLTGKVVLYRFPPGSIRRKTKKLVGT